MTIPQESKKPYSYFIDDQEITPSLIPSQGLGTFILISPNGYIYTRFHPEYQQVLALPREEEEAEIKVILTLGGDDRELALRLSLLALREGVERYKPSDFHHIVSDLLDEDQSHRIETGAKRLKVELDRSFDAICVGLLRALDIGLDEFYDEYLKVMFNIDPNEAEAFKKTMTREHFIYNYSINLDESFSPHIYPASTSLTARWIKPIINAVWYKRVNGKWTPTLHDNVSKTLIHVSTAAPVQLKESVNEQYQIGTELIDPRIGGRMVWLDTGRFQRAGLSPQAVEFVLRQHNQALIIDVVRLLVDKWTEDLLIQEVKKFDEPRGYQGLVDELGERYDLSTDRKARQKVIGACRFLDAVRWGPSFENHVKFFSFETGTRPQDELTVSYMKGFTKQLSSERLIPMIQVPKGQPRSRATNNRLGLCLAQWLVENSQMYLAHRDLGIKLDEGAKKVLSKQVGYSRMHYLERALDSFEEESFIERIDGYVRLGEKNREEEALILEGARKVKRARIRGLRSAKKRNRNSR